MEFIPLKKAFENLEIAKEDSDAAFFLQLTYTGEMIVKFATIGLLACIEEDKSKHQYSQIFNLVRADSIGKWAESIEEILQGPTSHFIINSAKPFQDELIQKFDEDSWQYKSISELQKAIKVIKPQLEKMPTRIQGKEWFKYITELRNKTKGHGATNPDNLSEISKHLDASINIFANNLSLFKLPWAYLKRNLSGKYRVSNMSNDGSPFEPLKKDKETNLEDGVYVFLDTYRRVPLLKSDSNLTDFYLPNGGFNKNTFECLSYISDNRSYEDVTPYLIPPGDLPKSETEGLSKLEVINDKCFSNLPKNNEVYVKRKELEGELKSFILNDRHPVITLVGRGGIGKTSLAIEVLNEIAEEGYYKFIIWFSARDMDLLDEGVKTVTPNVLSIKDICKQYCYLLDQDSQKPQKDIENDLTYGLNGEPVLFVFDNFETIRNPSEVFKWIDTYIRLPNKALITSRIREFKADYPIEVKGMEEEEFYSLVEKLSNQLKITDIKNQKESLEDIYYQSDGHPYVIKVLLGEIADPKNSVTKPRRIISTKNEMLSALFERTFSNLSPVAKRVFLTVSNWKSSIPKIGLEAVLMRGANEPMDVENAIDELHRYSLIELYTSELDSSTFIRMPLSASIYGKQKLQVHQTKSAIEADTEILQEFGVGRVDEVKKGLKPRINKFVKSIASKVSKGESLENYTELLEYIGDQYPYSFLEISQLYEEQGLIEKGVEALQKFIAYVSQNGGPGLEKSGWEKLYSFFYKNGDIQGQVHSLVELCQIQDIDFSTISNAANDVNRLFYEQKFDLDSEEKRIQVEKIVSVMEKRIEKEGFANDFSRLSWLYLNIGMTKEAYEFASKGLNLDKLNHHCLNIVEKLK